MSDPFYSTANWARLKGIVRKRSGGRCEVPHCHEQAVVCDHIIARGNGGQDHESNLRDLCRRHDNQVKERTDGTRKNNGQFSIIGCDADGWPLDPGRR